MQAYPRNKALLDQQRQHLHLWAHALRPLRERGGDQWPFGDPDVSGIAETELTGIFTYGRRPPIWRTITRISFQSTGEGYDGRDQFAAVMRRFSSITRGGFVRRTYYPFLEWLRAARGPGKVTSNG